MSAWIVVPCLLALRDEYNRVSPNRDKGADGTIGDSSHSSSSDHTPDEDSVVLRARDADHVNEVHALDIDSSGPWPGGPAWFDASVERVVQQQRDDGDQCRLEYVIWNRRIASRTHGWVWRPYTGTSDPHTNHAHFSARYTSAQEADTRPWGVEEDTMTKAELLALLGDMEVRRALCRAVAFTDDVLPAPAGSRNPDGSPNTHWSVWGYLANNYTAVIGARTYAAAARDLAGRDDVDEQALAAALAQQVAAALPQGQPVTTEQLQAALVGALRQLAAA